MDPEEQDLLGDYRYRNYSSAIEKALRNFESSSEWADLISSLGKLNKVQCERNILLFVRFVLLETFLSLPALGKIENSLEKKNGRS